MYDFDSDLDFVDEDELCEDTGYHTRVQVVDFNRLAEMLGVVRMLRTLLDNSISDGQVKMEIEPESGYGTIQIETDELVFYNPKEFTKIIRSASNFEVYPLTNGKIRVAFMFYDLSVDTTL